MYTQYFPEFCEETPQANHLYEIWTHDFYIAKADVLPSVI